MNIFFVNLRTSEKGCRSTYVWCCDLLVDICESLLLPRLNVQNSDSPRPYKQTIPAFHVLECWDCLLIFWELTVAFCTLLLAPIPHQIMGNFLCTWINLLINIMQFLILRHIFRFRQKDILKLNEYFCTF